MTKLAALNGLAGATVGQLVDVFLVWNLTLRMDQAIQYTKSQPLAFKWDSYVGNSDALKAVQEENTKSSLWMEVKQLVKSKIFTMVS